MRKLLPVTEYAKLCHVSKSTIYSRIKNNRNLQYAKINGKIKKGYIDPQIFPPEKPYRKKENIIIEGKNYVSIKNYAKLCNCSIYVIYERVRRGIITYATINGKIKKGYIDPQIFPPIQKIVGRQKLKAIFLEN